LCGFTEVISAPLASVLWSESRDCRRYEKNQTSFWIFLWWVLHIGINNSHEIARVDEQRTEAEGSCFRVEGRS
jgi:hypothetical protein